MHAADGRTRTMHRGDSGSLFDARRLRERIDLHRRLEGASVPFGADEVEALLDACDEAYERLQAGDVMGAKLTLGWER